jgi:DNA mismatch endonuclease, patch repair protein
MADVLTAEQRSFNMSRVRGRNTGPELRVRRALHAAGLRFRLQRRDLPGRPDLVLPRHRAVVFVHGCFWHGHGCQLFRQPATRPEFWQAKIAGNRARDAAALSALAGTGWRVLTIWECAMRGIGRLSEEQLKATAVAFIRGGLPDCEIAGRRL